MIITHLSAWESLDIYEKDVVRAVETRTHLGPKVQKPHLCAMCLQGSPQRQQEAEPKTVAQHYRETSVKGRSDECCRRGTEISTSQVHERQSSFDETVRHEARGTVSTPLLPRH